jgi:toxin ParE1/3/4
MMRWKRSGKSAVYETAVRAACPLRHCPYLRIYRAAHVGAATSVVRQIRAACRLLARHPGLGRETDIPGVRVSPTTRYPYLIYHRVRQDEVIVIHVRDGRRDAPNENEL